MNVRRLTLGVLTAACVVATVAWQQTGPRLWRADALAQSRSAPAPPLRPLWTQPFPHLRDAAVSPEGTFVGVVTGDGEVTLWKRGARKPLWTRAVPGAARLVLGAGNGCVLAYALLDPTHTTVTVLKGSTGAVLARTPLDGAIWDVAVSPDGLSAGIVTGSRSLYLYALDGHPRYHRWPLDGIGSSVALARDCAFLTAGTWDQSGVTCFTRDGQTRWHFADDAPPRSETADLFDVQMAADGGAILGLSYRNVRGAGGRLYLWRRDDRQPRWTYDLGGRGGEDTFFPKAQISPDGQFVAATYVQRTTRGDRSADERRLVLLDAKGQVLWDRGGALFPPTLLALTTDSGGPRVIISDGKRTLYALNAQGRVTDHAHLSGLIRQTDLSADGRWLLVYTGDGLLSAFPLTLAPPAAS